LLYFGSGNPNSANFFFLSKALSVIWCIFFSFGDYGFIDYSSLKDYEIYSSFGYYLGKSEFPRVTRAIGFDPFAY